MRLGSVSVPVTFGTSSIQAWQDSRNDHGGSAITESTSLTAASPKERVLQAHRCTQMTKIMPDETCLDLLNIKTTKKLVSRFNQLVLGVQERLGGETLKTCGMSKELKIAEGLLLPDHMVASKIYTRLEQYAKKQPANANHQQNLAALKALLESEYPVPAGHRLELMA